MVSSVSVTLAIALTTTTGFCGRRPWTIAATRSMALASSTEVPPNFMTIMGGASWTKEWSDGWRWTILLRRCSRDPSLRLKNGYAQDDAIGYEAENRPTASPEHRIQLSKRSSQVALRF